MTDDELMVWGRRFIGRRFSHNPVPSTVYFIEDVYFDGQPRFRIRQEKPVHRDPKYRFRDPIVKVYNAHHSGGSGYNIINDRFQKHRERLLCSQ